MDAHNLAVVFGPTLIRVSEEDDMISSQGHFNKVLETIIKSYDLVFDEDGLETVDAGDEFEDEYDEKAQHTDDDISRDEAEESDSDDEMDPKDAKALYNYTARSRKELSFRKGDIIQVYKRSNDDWWDGCLDGQDGYIPCAYVQLLDGEDSLDGVSSRGSPPESTPKPNSLPLERHSVSDETFPSPPSTRTTPITPTGHRSASTGDDVIVRSSPVYLRHVHKPTTPEVIPEDQHVSSFKRTRQRPDSPTKLSANSLERSRSLENRENRESFPKVFENKNKATSLPRSSPLWQKRGGVDPVSPVAEARGIAEGMNSPSSEMPPQQLTRAPPPAPKPKPKPKVPKRNSNPSTELIASLQAGAMARTARESREVMPDEMSDELPPPPPPCSEREVIGGEIPSPPSSPVAKHDTFL